MNAELCGKRAMVTRIFRMLFLSCFTICKVKTIPIQVHCVGSIVGLGLCVLAVAVLAIPAWTMTALFLSTNVSILAHELGHALVAKQQGMKGVIILVPAVGGASKLEGEVSLTQCFWIVLAGPAANIALWLVLWCFTEMVTLVVGRNVELLQKILSLVAQLNLVCAWSNLIPVLPLDGGLMTRCALAALIARNDPTENAWHCAGYISMFFSGVVGAGSLVAFCWITWEMPTRQLLQIAGFLL